MGCYYGTCALTGLPIEAGDPVIAFIVSNKGRTGGKVNALSLTGSVHPDDSYFPVSGIIHGNYNDYGSIEEAKSGALGTLWTENVGRSFGVSFEHMDQAIDDISQDKIDGLGLWMVRQDIACEMLSAPFDDSYDNQCFEKFETALTNSIRQISQAIPSITDPMEAFRFVSDIVGPVRRDAFSAPNIGSLQRQFEQELMKPTFFQNTDENTVTAMVQEYFQVRRLNEVLMELRRTWGPTSGRGSQSQSLGMYKRLAEESLKAISRINARQDELTSSPS